MRFEELTIGDIFEHAGYLFQKVPGIHLDNCCSPTYNAVLADREVTLDTSAFFSPHFIIKFISHGEYHMPKLINARRVPFLAWIVQGGRKWQRVGSTEGGYIVFQSGDDIMNVYGFDIVETTDPPVEVKEDDE